MQSLDRVCALLCDSQGAAARPAGRRRIRFQPAPWLLIFIAAWTGTAFSQRTLSTARDAHSLSAEEARRSYPVRLRAVVTYWDPDIDPRHGALFVQDETGGVFVAVPDRERAVSALRLGMLVQVTGNSSPGDFASTVDSSEIRVLAPRYPLSQPVEAGLADLRAGLEDCKRVEIEGVVQSIVSSKNNMTLEVATVDGTIGATTRRLPGTDYAGLIDSKIRLQGVAAPIFNHNRQITGARIFFQDASQLAVESSGPKNPFLIPPRPISDLSRYATTAGLGHRVHVQGTVTLSWPGRLICVQDAIRGVCSQSQQGTGMQTGHQGDLVGFVQSGGYGPTLTDAAFRDAGPAGPLNPPHISEEKALRGDYDAELVQIDGQVIGRDVVSGLNTLLLASGKQVFAVQLSPDSPANSLDAIPNGSILRVTGICSVQVDARETLVGVGFGVADSFRILARSPADILVLRKPSMWTAGRILLLLVLVLALTALVLAWVYVLRRRVEQQTRVIRESEERFRHLAQHDALTALPTRRVLRERLGSALDAARQVPTKLALLMVDLDDFKSINDTLGHHAGDEALRLTAERLISAVRPCDTVARMGGDEFLILLNGLDEDGQPENIASRIVETFSVNLPIGSTDVSLSVSIGVFRVFDVHLDLDVLLKKVDAAMYSAKSSGRNCFKSFSSEMEVASYRTFQMRSQLSRALANNEFHLQYQPLIDLKTGGLMGFEALLRWKNPELGTVPPDEFIPIAEESRLIVQIGEWVVDEAIREIALLGKKCNQDLLISVNLSPRQFLDEGLTELLRNTLAKHNLNPHHLKLEITERTLMSHAPDVQRVLRSIRALGVQLAIDDFGVGFSSLSYIARLPIDWIKVDRSLTCDCRVNTRSAAVLRAIIAMAHSIGIRVIAEGVETAELYALVQNEACDVGQGYWISRPVQADTLESLVAAHNQQLTTFQ